MIEHEERIIERDALARFREEWNGRKVVFTNGCFDIIHRGHVELLYEARANGDCLVVGINSDDSVRRLKGEGRPLVNESDRAFVLLALRPVDFVTVFDEDTPLETITALRPDVLVKGAEYERGDIVGADFVEESGGLVVRASMLDGHSTSGMIRSMKPGTGR